MMNVTNVIFMTGRRPPYLRMSTSSFMPCMTETGAEEQSALKKPCVIRCAMAKA